MKFLRSIGLFAAILTLAVSLPSREAKAQIYCPQATFGTKGVTPTAGQWWLCLNWLQQSADATLPFAALPSGDIFVGNAMNAPAAVAMSGDATLSNSGSILVTKTNGVAFGTAATANTGTSGSTIPLNNGGFIQTGLAIFRGEIQPEANSDSTTIAIGGSALASLSVLNSFDLGIGSNAAGETTTGVDIVAVGGNCLEHNTTGSRISCFGSTTLQRNTTGHDLFAGGYGSLINNTTGSFSTTTGAGSLYGGDCDSNTFDGYDAGQGISGPGCGGDNSGFGRDVMADGPVTGTNNFGGGEGALNKLTSGSSNDATGSGSLGALTTGSFDDAYGRGALANYNASNSAAMGYLACVHATNGDNLLCLGANTGATLVTGANDILLGQGIDTPLSTTSNYMSLADIIKSTGINTPSSSATDAAGTWTFDSPILAPNGAAATPGYSFTNATDAGCFLTPTTHALSCQSGSAGVTSNGGGATIFGGAGGATSGNGGAATLQGGTPVDGNGGNATLIGAAGVSATATARNGGNVRLIPGVAVNGGTDGSVQLFDSSSTTRIKVQGTQTTITGFASVSTLSASPGPVFSDGSKNLTSTAPTQSANTVYAGPTTGAAASSTFRALVAADMPSGVAPVLSGTTASIGGGALVAGTCATATVSVMSSTTSMTVEASPAGGTYPGDGIYWRGYVSTNGTVTVNVCAAIAATPTATTYNVRVLQ